MPPIIFFPDHIKLKVPLKQQQQQKARQSKKVKKVSGMLVRKTLKCAFHLYFHSFSSKDSFFATCEEERTLVFDA